MPPSQAVRRRVIDCIAMKAAQAATELGASRGAEEALLLGRRAASLGRVLCLIGAAVGALGLLGWITGVSFLTTMIPGQPQMKVNTALSLLLLGVAGTLRQPETASRAARVLASAAALIALVIGLGTTVEYATGRDFGIDQLLFEADVGPYPGRPSPLTAVALALLAGASLLFDNRPRSRARPSEMMILGAGLVAFAAIVGAAFGAGPLYRLRTAPITGVAVPTAVGLLLISAGMFLERPATGLARLATSPGPGGALLRRLMLPGIVLPVLLAFGLSRAFTLVGIQDVALLFATLVALATVGGLVFLVSSAAPLDRAHDALAASRAETRELLQQAPDGIFVADLEGRYTDVNRAGCEMLGYSRDEIVGKRIVDLIPPRRHRPAGRLQAAPPGGQGRGIRVAVAAKGRARDLPVEVSAKILAGRPLAGVRPRHQRAQADRGRAASVRVADSRTRRISSASRTRAESRSTQSGRSSHGRLARRLPGGEDADSRLLPGRGAGVRLRRHPQGDDRARPVVGRDFIFDTGRPRVAIPVSDEHFIIRDPSGERVLGMGTVTRDITERKRAEEALRLSEARFSGIISISADAIISIDEDQRITLFNDGAESIFGYSRAEAIGAPLDILIPERFHAVHRQHIARFAAGRSTSRHMGERLATIVGRRKNGEEFPAEAAISKLQVGGRPILTVALRDITQRKRAEEGAAVPVRGRGGAGLVARLRADAVDPGAARGSRFRRLVHRRPRGGRRTSQAAQGRQRARQARRRWPPSWSSCRSIGVYPTSPDRCWRRDGRSSSNA